MRSPALSTNCRCYYFLSKKVFWNKYTLSKHLIPPSPSWYLSICIQWLVSRWTELLKRWLMFRLRKREKKKTNFIFLRSSNFRKFVIEPACWIVASFALACICYTQLHHLDCYHSVAGIDLTHSFWTRVGYTDTRIGHSIRTSSRLATQNLTNEDLLYLNLGKITPRRTDQLPAGEAIQSN